MIRPAEAGDASAVAAFLHRPMKTRIPEARGRRLFAPPWERPDATLDYGRVAEDAGRLVGFIARTYSQRIWQGRVELVASIGSWYVHRDCRGRGLGVGLYESILADRGAASYTVVSIAPHTYELYDRWGFDMLDDHRWLWRRRGKTGVGLEVLTDPADFLELLDERQQRMLHEHTGFAMWPALLRCDRGDCLMVLSSKYKGADVLYLDLMHLSHPEVFVAVAQEVAERLLPEGDAVLAVDGRFVAGAPESAERVTIPVPRRFISERMPPAAFDFMYTEVPLLDLKLG